MHKEQEDGKTVTHISTEEVRSGASTHVVRYVLGISLTLVILMLAIVVAGGFWKTDQTGADNSRVESPAKVYGS